MEGKKSIVLYVDLIHTFDALEDAEAGKLIKHIFRYVNDLSPVAPDKITQIAFEPIKLQLKRDLKKWEEIRGKRSEAGKASASKRQQVSTSVETSQQVPTVNVTVTDTVIVSKYTFDQFWDLYAKKIDAHKCKIKWDKLDDDTKEKIMTTLPDYISSTPDTKYRANPLTWINGKRWEDEIVYGKKKCYITDVNGGYYNDLSQVEIDSLKNQGKKVQVCS
jgi:hypothetical protein